MLAGILLLLSCGSDNNAPIDDPGNTTNHYLQLQPNGLNAIKVSCTEENFVFPFQIKAVGNGSNQGGEAQINSWSEDESVSYTHLDVYKRQGNGSIIIFNRNKEEFRVHLLKVLNLF